MEYRVVVLGNKQVGRTSFVKRFIEDKFPSSTEVTIEDCDYKKKISIPGEEFCYVKVVDIAYTGSDSNMKNSGQSYIFVFDITDKVSFKDLKLFVNRVREANSFDKSYTFPFCIVGNKVDIVNVKPGAREVKKADAVKLCKSLGGTKDSYFECSARDGINITEPYELAVKLLWKHLEKASGVTNHGEHCMIQ